VDEEVGEVVAAMLEVDEGVADAVDLVAEQRGNLLDQTP
jgi:hypothetical protein